MSGLMNPDSSWRSDIAPPMTERLQPKWASMGRMNALSPWKYAADRMEFVTTLPATIHQPKKTRGCRSARPGDVGERKMTPAAWRGRISAHTSAAGGRGRVPPAP